MIQVLVRDACPNIVKFLVDRSYYLFTYMFKYYSTFYYFKLQKSFFFSGQTAGPNAWSKSFHGFYIKEKYPTARIFGQSITNTRWSGKRGASSSWSRAGKTKKAQLQKAQFCQLTVIIAWEQYKISLFMSWKKAKTIGENTLHCALEVEQPRLSWLWSSPT